MDRVIVPEKTAGKTIFKGKRIKVFARLKIKRDNSILEACIFVIYA